MYVSTIDISCATKTIQTDQVFNFPPFSVSLDFPGSASCTSSNLTEEKDNSKTDPSGNNENGHIVTSAVGAGTTANYPRIPSIHELQDLKPAIPPFLNPTTGTGRQGKRVAFSEIKKVPKTTETGMYLRLTNPLNR